jgi:hypothetical protein
MIRCPRALLRRRSVFVLAAEWTYRFSSGSGRQREEITSTSSTVLRPLPVTGLS